jgi:hypothetical protein
MPERPDLRKIAASISEALEGFERDALAEILTYVFKEYVVEGVPPQLMGRADTVEDLGELNFPEIIRALQTRLDVPELGLFQVQDDVVLVRVGGALTPLTVDDVVQRQPLPEPPREQPTETEPAPAAARSSVEEARARGRGDLAGFDREAIRAPAPRPRGISINGRTPRGPSNAPAQATPPAQPPPREQAAPQAPASEKQVDGEDSKPREGEDSSSIRFSLLELD